MKTIPYKIGALVFTGHHREARLLFESFRKDLSPKALAFASFHIGISYTRTSQYREARSLFIENLRRLRLGELGNVEAFFAYQGVSFYRYFFSKHNKSQFFAEKGYSYLLKEKNVPPLFLVLSLDIQGHNLIQMGRIQFGLKALSEALGIARQNELHNLVAEIRVSHSLYQSEFDDNLDTQLKTLKKLLAELDANNDYSRSELIIQIAKTHMLKGEFAQANSFLLSNFATIYENENKRKLARLNTLLAQLMIHKGHLIEALSLLDTAEKALDPLTDFSLILPVIGLKIKILRRLGQDPRELIERAHQLVQKIDRGINKNIQAREEGSSYFRPSMEDRLGAAFDAMFRKDSDALKVILEKGLLGLIPQLFRLKPGEKVIIVSQANDVILTSDEEGVFASGKSLTKSQLQLIFHLSSAGVSKEKLVEAVWGHTYDPLRHDSLVYTGIARIRKLLGRKKDWLVGEENRYHLIAGVRIVLAEEVPKESQPKEETRLQPLQNQPELNYRQFQIVNKPPDRPLSVSEYGQLWNVTRMTALRDLRELCNDDFARRIGKGKATRYIIDPQLKG